MNKIRIIPCRICGTNVVTVGSGGARAYCNEEHRKLGFLEKKDNGNNNEKVKLKVKWY